MFADGKEYDEMPQRATLLCYIMKYGDESVCSKQLVIWLLARSREEIVKVTSYDNIIYLPIFFSFNSKHDLRHGATVYGYTILNRGYSLRFLFCDNSKENTKHIIFTIITV